MLKCFNTFYTLNMQKEYKQCQSCGMPLVKKGVSMKGTESDGSESNMYCNLCFENGKFKDELTLNEMKKIVDDALKENGWVWPLRFMAKMQLPSLARWKK